MTTVIVLFLWLNGHPYPRVAYAASEESTCWHDVAALKARGHLAECRIARLASVIGGKE